jgi:NAD(P)-dependent dehydrogenase (short-subunit alcohol dehydrogenase family)
MLKEFSLEGKNAIVTGGGSGLGRVMCLALAEAGANVVIAGRRPGPIHETAEMIRKIGPEATAIPSDVIDSKQVNNLVEKAIAKFGQIDILINNAGIAKGVDPSGNDPLTTKMKPIWELTDEEWIYSINTNLTGTFYCCRAIARHMVEHKNGKIINLSSAGALRAGKGNFGYGSAKGAIISFTKALAITFAGDNIQANCIIPGFIPIEEMAPEIRERSSRFFPMQRFADPSEIGPLAVFLASSASDYITGQCFPVDGATSVNYAPAGFIPE